MSRRGHAAPVGDYAPDLHLGSTASEPPPQESAPAYPNTLLGALAPLAVRPEFGAAGPRNKFIETTIDNPWVPQYRHGRHLISIANEGLWSYIGAAAGAEVNRDKPAEVQHRAVEDEYNLLVRLRDESNGAIKTFNQALPPGNTDRNSPDPNLLRPSREIFNLTVDYIKSYLALDTYDGKSYLVPKKLWEAAEPHWRSRLSAASDEERAELWRVVRDSHINQAQFLSDEIVRVATHPSVVAAASLPGSSIRYEAA